MKFHFTRLWAALNKKWRPVSKEELRRMPLSDLEAIIKSVDDWDKGNIDGIWEKERRAFEVH